MPIYTLCGRIVTEVVNTDFRPFFVVNTAVNNVKLSGNFDCPLMVEGGSGGPPLNVHRWIVPKDGFNIISFGITFPHYFTVGDYPFSMGIDWEDELGVFGGFTELQGFQNAPGAQRKFLRVPFENAEFPLGVYVKWPDDQNTPPTTGKRIQLIARISFNATSAPIGGDISMIGVPSALNGQTFRITPFVKIETTKEIQSI